MKGDNQIKAINEVSTENYYYSFAISKSSLRTGDGNDSYEIKNSKGYYGIGLHNSSINSSEGNDSISIELNEVDFVYGLSALEGSSIDTGSGDDKVSIKLQSSRDDAFSTQALNSSSLKTGSGDDEIFIEQKNSSNNINVYISGPISSSSTFDFGDGNDTAEFISDGYGLKSGLNAAHKIYLGDGSDNLKIDSKLSSLSDAYLYGGDGDDNVNLSSSKEFYYAIENSKIYLDSGNDILTISSSNNSIVYGGSGSDEVILPGNYEEYLLTRSSNNFNLRKANDGFFSLEGQSIEKITFKR